MSTVSLLIAVTIAIVLVLVVVLTRRSDRVETPDQVAAWELARSEENSLLGRILNSVARPVSRLDLLRDHVTTRQYRFIQSRLLASGKYGRDVDVFVSTQVAAVLIGVGMLGLGFLTTGIYPFAFAVLGVGLAVYPWNVVSKHAKLRAAAVSDSLPEFAELLQMSISGGMGLESALAFTAERLDGPVSVEVENMLTIIRNNPSEEVQAYLLAGERLGTAEAKTFFGTLLQSQMEGAKLLASLSSQAHALRVAAFQRQRAEVKKLPVKLVVMFGLHLLPLLFAVTMWPTMYSLAHMATGG